MAEMALLPSRLDIEAVAGDDVPLHVELTSCGCEGENLSIAGISFAATMVANGTHYDALVVKDTANVSLTLTWTGNMTTSAGAGKHHWYMTMTDVVTRT